jgi:hypothetical protein
MHHETSFPQVHHDLSRRNIRQAGFLDQDQIAWKDRWHHAGAADAQANFSECADYFLCQSARQLDRSIPHAAG